MRQRLPILVSIFLGFAIAAAPILASDADLQIYAGVSTWNSDPFAATILLPTDGKKITADSNTAGKAPVNRGTKQLKDLVNAIHDGIFGSRAGSQLRTVRALEADGTGGLVETNTDGQIRASVGFESKDPSNGTAHLNHTRLRFTKTASSSTNPARNLGLNNELRALLVPKLWAFVTTDGAGGSTDVDGANFFGSLVNTPAASPYLRLLFASPMADVLYSVQCTCLVGTTPTACAAISRSTTSVDIKIGAVDAAATATTCDVLIMGRQDTP
jgi:hypothetical protein